MRDVKDRLRDLIVTSPQQNASDEFTHFLFVLMVEQTLCTSETITHWALANNRQRNVSNKCMTRDCLLQHVQATSCRPQWLTYVGLCFHIVWCNSKGVGDREILETYLSSASKNISETDIFPHGTKCLLTSVTSVFVRLPTGQFKTDSTRVWSFGRVRNIANDYY
jgi:hypothetical protein